MTESDAININAKNAAQQVAAAKQQSRNTPTSESRPFVEGAAAANAPTVGKMYSQRDLRIAVAGIVKDSFDGLPGISDENLQLITSIMMKNGLA